MSLQVNPLRNREYGEAVKALVGMSDEETNEALAEAVWDRTHGTSDAIAEHVSLGLVRSVGGVTFDAQERASAKTTAGVIIDTDMILIGAASLAGAAEASENVLVSRWGRPGLKTGDWVMKGGANYRNYILSGKWQPGFTNEFASFGSGRTYLVSRTSLRWPAGILGRAKGLLGQRIYGGTGLP
jgi:hypothetical protein